MTTEPRFEPLRTLHATHCILEPQVAAHAPEMFRVLSDPAIYEFENEPPSSLEWLARRYERLESRRSADGSQQWLNWVVRVPSGELAGYVQATVRGSGIALVAYELNSRFWRQGIGSSAVHAMLDELRSEYGVQSFVAVLKAANYRSAYFGERDRRFRDRDRFGVGAGLRGEHCRDEVEDGPPKSALIGSPKPMHRTWVFEFCLALFSLSWWRPMEPVEGVS